MWVLYSLRDGWVLGSSVNAYTNLVPEYDQVENPTDTTTGDPPWVYANNVLRDATQPEIDASAANRALDLAERDMRTASDFVSEPEGTLPRIIRALAVLMLNEFNARADKINEIITAISSAGNTNQLISNVSQVQQLPQRTKQQLIDTIKQRIEANE